MHLRRSQWTENGAIEQHDLLDGRHMPRHARQHPGQASPENRPAPFRHVGASVMQAPASPQSLAPGCPVPRKDSVDTVSTRTAQNMLAKAGGITDDGKSVASSHRSPGWTPRDASTDNRGTGWVPGLGGQPNYVAGNAISNLHRNAEVPRNDVAGRANLGAGLVPRADAPNQYVMGNAHGPADGIYGGSHAGRDTAGHLGSGLVPAAHNQHMIGNARGYIEGNFVGRQASKDVSGNAYLNADQRYYPGQHAGKDNAGNLGAGMLPRAEAAQYILGPERIERGPGPGGAYGGICDQGFYMGQHAGKIVAGNLGIGNLVPAAHASNNVAGGPNDLFDDLYGGKPAGKQVASARRHDGPVPPFDVERAVPDRHDHGHKSHRLVPSSNDWFTHHNGGQLPRGQEFSRQERVFPPGPRVPEWDRPRVFPPGPKAEEAKSGNHNGRVG